MPAVMNPQALLRYRLCGNRQFFGGDSSSSQTTNNTDARVVGGDDSQNASITGNQGPVTVTSTDHQAVAKSLDLALKGIETQGTITREVVTANSNLLDGALKNSAAANQQFATELSNIKGNDVRTLVIAGLAVVGIVAVQLFRKG